MFHLKRAPGFLNDFGKWGARGQKPAPRGRQILLQETLLGRSSGVGCFDIGQRLLGGFIAL